MLYAHIHRQLHRRHHYFSFVKPPPSHLSLAGHPLQPVRLQEVRDHLVCPGSIVMEVDVVTRVRLQRDLEGLRLAEVALGRLLDDARAIAVADNVVGFGGDHLRYRSVSQPVQRQGVHRPWAK